MMTRPFLVTWFATLTRSLLFSLGLDHVLIDSLADTFIGAGAILLTIAFVGIRTSRRSARRTH